MPNFNYLKFKLYLFLSRIRPNLTKKFYIYTSIVILCKSVICTFCAYHVAMANLERNILGVI
jgi:hypothetical protein